MLTGFIVLYLIFTLAVGFWASRRIKSTDDYTLAGRSLSALVVGVTIFATWFGPELIMGVPGLFVRDGIRGTITDLFGTLVCLSLVGFFFARQMYRLNIVTINDFFRLRYTPAIETVTSIINVFTYFSWIAAQFVALALLFNTILGLPVAWGIVLGASVVLIYTYIGGMWAVSITDLIQTVMIVAGLLFVMVRLLGQTDGLPAVVRATPEGFFNLLPEPGFHHWMDYLTLWLVFGIGAIPSQEIYQRLLSARSETASARGTFLSAGMLFGIGAIPLVIALCINQVYPELMLENDGQNMIPAMVSRYTGLPLQIMFFGALISAILSTSSGAMLAPATVIGENLIKPHFKDITDGQLLFFTRLCVVFVAIVSAMMAFFNTSIHGLVVDSVMLYLVCLIVPFALGLHWKRASVKGAWAAVLAGGAVWLLCKSLETRIEPWMFGLAASLAAMIVGSLLTPDESRAQFEEGQRAPSVPAYDSA
jgi:SSS family transporter